jgi:type 1 fimbria pilin
MKFLKFTLALAMFVTSVTFQETVIMTKDGVASTWGATVSSNQAFALMQAEMYEERLEMMY